jgi:protein-L-isoaspartate(D-aspartate) O-methyltransferase
MTRSCIFRPQSSRNGACFVLAVALASMALFSRVSEGQDSREDPYRGARLKMVENYIIPEGIRNERVLNAMRTVPRHLFVTPDRQADVYKDVIVPIGFKQTLSTAYIVAYMTEAIDPQPTDRVLEIGTGSGYQAAVLSGLVKEVYTIEIVEPLGKEAASRLARLGYNNVKVKVGDGYEGWPRYAPFDKIIVTCSPEKVPQPLLDQLKDGGKMIIPLGERFHQTFYLYEKVSDEIVKSRLLPTLFVPMTGKAQGDRSRPITGTPELLNGSFKKSANGVPDDWFYVRQGELNDGGGPRGLPALVFTNQDPGRDAHALQGLGMDGTRVRAVKVSVWVKNEGILPGKERYELPGVFISFFDGSNKKVGETKFLPFGLGTLPWRHLSTGEWKVPPDARMAMFQIGLRGATGRLSIADVRLTPLSR